MQITDVLENENITIQALVLRYIEHTQKADAFESDEAYLTEGASIFKQLIEKMYELGLDSDDSKIAYLVTKEHRKKQKLAFEKRFYPEGTEETL